MTPGALFEYCAAVPFGLAVGIAGGALLQSHGPDDLARRGRPQRPRDSIHRRSVTTNKPNTMKNEQSPAAGACPNCEANLIHDRDWETKWACGSTIRHRSGHLEKSPLCITTRDLSEARKRIDNQQRYCDSIGEMNDELNIKVITQQQKHHELVCFSEAVFSDFAHMHEYHHSMQCDCPQKVKELRDRLDKIKPASFKLPAFRECHHCGASIRIYGAVTEKEVIANRERAKKAEAEVERLKANLRSAVEIAEDFQSNGHNRESCYYEEGKFRCRCGFLRSSDELDQLKATLNHTKK